MFSSRFSLLSVLALTLAFAGCPQPEEEHTVHTEKSATGDDGVIKVTWSESMGMPMRAGAQFKLVVTNASDAALTGAAVNLEFEPAVEGSGVFMLTTTESATTPGTYESQTHDFAKAETWHMAVHVVKGEETAADHIHDHATFAVEIP